MKNISQIIAFIKPLDGWLSSHEGYFLYRAAMKVRGNIVEIGSWKGKSTICLAAGVADGKVFAVDPHKGEFSKQKGIGKAAPTYKKFLVNLTKAGVKKNVVPIIATSQEAAKQWKKPIDFLFIDGLHDYKHTHQDFSLWEKSLSSQGIVAFHDAFCGHEGPERVVQEELLPKNGYSEFGVVGSIIYAKKKEANTLFEKLNRIRSSTLIRLSLKLHKSNIPSPLKFFIIHRVIKLLLLNQYTFQLLSRGF